METLVPSPQTSLLILLGASAWPLSLEFQGSEAFANAARGLKAYFLDPQRFGLPAENLLDLFDEDRSVDELDVEIGQFLERRLAAMKAAGNPARDLLLCFIGHGGFVGHDADFYLAIRRTRMASLRASGMQMTALADTLNEHSRHLRRIIILDCCFAGAAFSAFMSGPAEVALQKTIGAFEVRYKTIGFPTKGTTLLCSSGHKSPSVLLPDDSSTMFTKALLDALSHGTIPIRDRLSLREVKDITADFLHKIETAPRPEVFSPDQSEGDIADIPFFPNPQAALPTAMDMPASPATVTPSRTGLSKSKNVLLVALILLLIGGSIGLFSFPVVKWIYSTTIGHTATTTRPVPLILTIAQASATAKAAATATSIADQNPYPPFGGTLKLNDPLIDNNKGYKWDMGLFAEGSCSFTGREYHVEASQHGRHFGCIDHDHAATFTDFAFQVQMNVIRGNTGGILFRQVGAQGAYYMAYFFTIDTNGSYQLTFFDGKYPMILKQGTSSYINIGLNQPNTIAVVMQGSTINLYANLRYLDSISNSTLSSGGIGFVAVDIIGEDEVAFHNAKVWTL